MAKRHITVSVDLADTHPTLIPPELIAGAHEKDLLDAHLAHMHEHVAAGRVTNFSVRCSSRDPHEAVAADVPPEHAAAYRDQADRQAAVDALVHGHPDCRPGASALEHAETVLEALKRANAANAEMVRLVKYIDPKAVAVGREKVRQKAIAAAAALAQAEEAKRARDEAVQRIEAAGGPGAFKVPES